MKMLTPLVLMLGGNLPGSKQKIEEAVNILSARFGKVVSESGLYLSDPWGMTEQPSFLNKAVVLETVLDPHAVLEFCRNTEIALGRTPGVVNGPRLIDIDIMFMGAKILKSETLTIPHQRLHFRNFNLIPLNEIIPDFVHPVICKTIKELTLNSPDKLNVWKTNA